MCVRDRKKSKKEKGCFIHTNTHTNAQTKKKKRRRRREEKKRQGLAERLAQSPSIAALGKTREDKRRHKNRHQSVYTGPHKKIICGRSGF